MRKDDVRLRLLQKFAKDFQAIPRVLIFEEQAVMLLGTKSNTETYFTIFTLIDGGE